MKNLQRILNQKGLSIFKITLTVCCVLFGVVSLIVSLLQGESNNISHCLAEMLLVCLPAAVGVLMQFRMSLPVYIFLHFYAISPLLGEMYHLYHVFSWWDDLLHLTGGIVFALFGVFLFKYFTNHEKTALVSCAVFALCFSIALSTIWEIYEYGCDYLFGTDMQKDTVLSSIDSYYLNDTVGEIGRIEQIETVTVNGEPLPVQGYLDIGLNDTMKDLMCASLGALLAMILFLIDRDRHPVFVPLKGADCESEASRLRIS